MSTHLQGPRFALRHTASGLRHPTAATRRLPLGVRCLASRGSGGGDKSWSEIAAEAGQLATDLAKKVGSTVTNAASKVAEAIVPSETKEERPQRRENTQQRRDIYRREEEGFGGGLVGGLLGRAVGSMLKSAVGAIGEQLREAAEQVADVQESATRVIQSDAKLRQAMGTVRVLPPISQSSMSSSINGKASRTITLIMPVVGADGRAAQAQVQYVEGRDRGFEQMNVTVRLPNGQTMQLDGSSSPAVKTIDVEWRSVDDK